MQINQPQHPTQPSKPFNGNRQASQGNAWQRLPGAFKVGIIASLVGFFVSLSSSSSRTVNGDVVSCSYLDVAAFIFAAIAAGCAVGTLMDKRSPMGLRVGLAGVLLALGVIHVLRGLGILNGPC